MAEIKVGDIVTVVLEESFFMETARRSCFDNER